MRSLRFESLEDRRLLAVNLLDQQFLGGAGDQQGTDVTLDGGQVFVSANNQPASQTAGDSSFIASFSTPTTAGSTPNWQTTFSLGTTFGVAAYGPSVHGVGWSHPGSGSGTIDGTGGTEVKAIVTDFNSATGAFNSVSFPPVTFNASPGTDYFIYNGVESHYDALINVESATPYLYAAGAAQPCSYTAYVLSKYDAATGNLVGAATDSTVGLSFTACFAPSGGGGSVAQSVTELGGDLFMAGSSGWAIEGDTTSRPTIWRYDTSLSLLGRTKDSSLSGVFNDVSEFGGSVYAVGQTGSGGAEDYLVQKFDSAGNRQWSTNPSETGSQRLFGVVGVGGTLYAVGYSDSVGAGGEDVVILEIDPATGNILDTTTYGGADDDRATEVVADGTELYVVGESRSFTVGGNGAGENDAIVLRYATSLDFGDAPDPTYATLLDSNGARHVLGSGLFLGEIVDAEPDGQPDATATGDDLAGMPGDEDGVIAATPLVAGQPASVTVVASAPGLLDGWIDVNANGVFDHPDEHLAGGVSVPVVAGPNVVNFSLPANAVSGTSFARLRISSAGSLPPTGLADDGEVEDYEVDILQTGSIHGFKYEDIDADGVYDDMVDLPLGGVEFTLTGTDVLGNAVNETGFTNLFGEFWFADLVPGNYTVTETVPAGYVATTPVNYATTLASGEELVAFDGQAMLDPGDPQFEVLVGAPLMFGNTVPGSIHGFKYEDVDGNGVYNDAVDLPLAGVDFTLTGTDGQGNVINTVETTDVNGEFWFTSLLASANGVGPATGYTVTETVPTGFVATTPTSYDTDLLSRQELVALPGQAKLPPPVSTTIDFDDVDAGGGGLSVLGFVDYNPASPNPGNPVGAEMDVDPVNDFVYMAAGFGSGSKIIRFDVSNPASIPAFTHINAGYGSGIAVDPVTGRYAATDGFGSQLGVFNPNTSVFDTESLIGCGGSVAAGTGTFAVSTQCSDDFFIYNQSSMTISGSLDSTAVGSAVEYNPGSGHFYKMRNPGPAPFFAHETLLLGDSGVLGVASTAAVTAANGVTNRIYVLDAGTITALDGNSHTAVAGFTPISGLSVTGNTTVDTSRDRLYIPTSTGIQIHDGSTGAALGTLALSGGFTPRNMVMEQGDDFLYVRASDASNNQRLVVLEASGGGGPITGAALDSYLNQLGISITDITPSGLGEIVDDRVGFPSQVLRAFSDFNVFWHDSPNAPYSYTLNFAVPQTSFSFVRPELFGATPSGLIVSPWRARAFDSTGGLLDTVSEPQLAFFDSTPPVPFTLNGPGITSVIFDRTTTNTIAGLNRVPTDNWTLDVPTDPRREVLVGSDLMFGNAVPSSIHGFKFEDVDGDGVYNDLVDAPLVGVDFTLTGTDGQGNVINTTETTDVYGEFAFTGLLPSVAGAGPATGYTITETVPSGFVATTPTVFGTDLESRQELVALPGQAMLPPATIVTVDFDALDAGSVPPLEVLHGSQVDNYLASFGIFVGEAVRIPSGGEVPTEVGIVDQANESRYIAPSPENWFQIDDLLHRNEPFRYRLDFAEPLDRFTFTRAELSAPPNSASPWTATALDALGTPLDTTGEGSIGNSPAVVHTLDGPGIASVVFERTIVNTSAGTAYPATDDFVLEVPDPRREVLVGAPLMFGNEPDVLTLWNVSVTTPVNEDDNVTLTGQILKPPAGQALTLLVDWDDGSAIEVFSYAAGTTSFSETHQYLDDDPTGTSSDDYDIKLTLTNATDVVPGQPIEKYSFTTIAQADPYSAAFPFVQFFATPAINDAGQVAFDGILTAGNLSGIFRGEGGPTTTIVGVGDTCDEGEFTTLSDPLTIDGSGTVLFRATILLDGTPDQYRGGIWGGSGGAITTYGPPAANPAEGRFFSGYVGEAGTAAMTFGVAAGNDLYLGNGGTPTLLYDHTLLTDPDIGVFYDVDINESGVVAAAAGPQPGVFWYIVRGNGGPLTIIADATDDPLYQVGNVSINNQGVVAFYGQDENVSYWSIFTGSGGALTEIVNTINGSSPYSQFGSYGPAINDAGTVAFQATRWTTFDEGIFTGPDPVTDKVILEGDPLLGSTVTNLQFGSFGLNNAGQIVFHASLANSQQAIVRADPAQVSEALTTVTVNNVAPDITSLSIDPSPAHKDYSFDLTIDFTDPGTDDEHMVTIDWDDGNPPQEVPVPIEDRTITIPHTYTATGDYSVSITVDDDDSGTDTDGLLVEVVTLDLGDAPDPTYPTLLASNGARHVVVPGFQLGAAVDAESDGQPNATATGDDVNLLFPGVLFPPGDEDGVVFTSPMIPGSTATVTVTASAAGGLLDAWVDFDANGTWAAGEQIFTSTSLSAGPNNLSFPVPAGAALGAQTFARFRFSSGGGLAPDGMASDGEVEDYLVDICRTTVTNTDDTGFGSLRFAILCSNAVPAVQTIDFNVAGAGPHTIAPGSALPSITDAVVIDGTTQPGYAGSPVIELDGSSAPAAVNGLRFNVSGAGSTVRGLAINRFDADGIFSRAHNGLFEDNYIGTNTSGTAALPNGGAGIHFINADDNVVSENLISGHATGILVAGSSAERNTIKGNKIGTNATGTGALANQVGVVIGSPDNVVGGATTSDRNLISGNDTGIELLTANATGNTILGNFIGTDATGGGPLTNQYGVHAIDAVGNTIGGSAIGAGNVISGNTKVGVRLLRADNNDLLRNMIGTDDTGAAAVANSRGVEIQDGDSNQIGSTVAGEGNIISGNNKSGLFIKGTSTSNDIFGNRIGTDLSGTVAVANQHGVRMSQNATSNIVGGIATGAGNQISGNAENGVLLAADGNFVEHNLVGTDATGLAALPNGNGIEIRTGLNNVIGGSDPNAGNVISGNQFTGIYITSRTTTGNLIQRNLIGTDANGTSALPNLNGIYINAAFGNVVGGTTAGLGNIISGNTNNGVLVDKIDAHDNRIEGNVIGGDVSATAAIGNNVGVDLRDAPNNTIGGLVSGAGNQIVGNTAMGVRIQGDDATGNLVQANDIGVTALGQPIANGDGIRVVNGPSGNEIGGTAAGAGNEIAHNSGRGVRIIVGTKNLIQQNSIHDNGLLGIDLNPLGATPNDAGDADTGANKLQNFPVITSATINGANLDIQYSVPSAMPGSIFPLTVEFFLADASGAEGQTYLGSHTYLEGTTPTPSIPKGTAAGGSVIVATATDADGNTSEFSAGATVPAPLLAAAGPADSSSNVAALTRSELDGVFTAAVDRWVAAGFAADLFDSVEVAIADLPGATLGWATGSSIVIDSTAAGHGWFVDGTPWDDSEFFNPQFAFRNPQSLDLLTAVMHELGHVAGLEDLDDLAGEDDLMYGWLEAGVRKTSLDESLADALFSQF